MWGVEWPAGFRDSHQIRGDVGIRNVRIHQHVLEVFVGDLLSAAFQSGRAGWIGLLALLFRFPGVCRGEHGGDRRIQLVNAHGLPARSRLPQ